MSMKKAAIIFVIAGILAFVQLTSASFIYNNAILRQTYSSGDTILGSINIGLINESYDSLITTNVNGSLTLGDLLRKNGFTPGVEFSCSSINCTTAYVIGNATSSITLTETQPVKLGFKLSGKNISVQGFSMDISGNAGPACTKQFSINLFFSTKRHAR